MATGATSDEDLGWPDYLAVVLYFVMVLAVGLYATCRAKTNSAQGYFLASKSSNWFLIGTSTFATNIGAPMFIGLAGSAAASGISVVMFEWHAMFMLVALGWLFLPVYRASGCYTMPQYLKLRYGGNRIRILLACIHIGVAIMTWIASQIYAGVVFISVIFKWDMYLSVLLILAVTAVYSVIGGLTAVLWTDAIQTFILVIGAGMLGILGLIRVGGWEGLSSQYPLAASKQTYWDVAVHGNRTCGLPREDWSHIFRSPDADYPWPGMIGGLTILATNAWCTDQICVQRSLSAKSVAHAKAGVLLAAYLKILPVLFFIFPGMISRVLFPEEIACSDPDVCESICNNRAGCSNFAYPFLVNRVMPSGFKGIMLAALLAALMSSLTSIFNSSSTLFTMDIYRKIRKHAKERELMVVGRLYILVLVGISVAWLPILDNLQGSQLWTYTQSIYSYMLPPFVATFYWGLFWKRTTETGAFCGIVGGLAVGIIRMGLAWSRPAPPCGSTEPDNQFSIVTKVNYLHFALISFVISSFIIVLVSLVTKPRTEAQLRRVTFWTRQDPKPQDVEDSEAEEEDEEEVKQDASGAENQAVGVKPTLGRRLLRFLCGVDEKPKPRLTPQQTLEMQLKATSIHEEPRMKRILDINAVVCLAVSIFLHAFFA